MPVRHPGQEPFAGAIPLKRVMITVGVGGGWRLRFQSGWPRFGLRGLGIFRLEFFELLRP